MDKSTHGHYKGIKYLHEYLCITKMHELFKVKCSDSDITYSLYKKYYKKTLQYDLVGYQYMFATSVKFYAAFQESKVQSENNEHTLGIVFDCMQNLELSKTPVHEANYLRHSRVNVFAVCDLKTDRTQFYIYDEEVAKKGENEVASFLNDYIKTYVPNTVTELNIFTGNCPGQNKISLWPESCRQWEVQNSQTLLSFEGTFFSSMRPEI
ncbi:hypothetical protein PR048_012954 [Dryococelus australis]|uniref:Uncharacterized protein n=1 Tax=Dryococelus australis TaxID=614101 RepID=A0ABQ9HQS3_9NEOP|nr:hypothetical protein PR048_012954 [Dryococelus australis]